MSEREGTGSQPTRRQLDIASNESQRAITDSDYEEPTGPSPKRRQAADKPRLGIEEVQVEKHRSTLGNARNRGIHEGATTIPHGIEEVGTHLPQLLAALTASTTVGDPAGLGQPILQEITMFGAAALAGTAGDGEGARILIDNFSGTQIIIRYMEVGGQVNPGIDRIGEGLVNIRDGIAEVGGQIRSFMNDLLRRLETQLMAVITHVSRGVSDDLFYVIDPVGGSIPVPLQYCRDYWTLDNILKAYLQCLPQAGGPCIERGDYSVVSEDGTFIVPVKFAQRVKAGIVLELWFTGDQDWKRVVQVYHLREKLSDGSAGPELG
ncbi:hypothetical protein B0H14DRAFT_3860069 [Mycena olivaceomarginata]|nr:hypothetical protein B0H14DRAFT_3860069 [Mycena olivaceomarginata]